MLYNGQCCECGAMLMVTDLNDDWYCEPCYEKESNDVRAHPNPFYVNYAYKLTQPQPSEES